MADQADHVLDRDVWFTNPVLIDEHAQLIAGHGRLEAAIRLGLGKVPAIRVSHLSEVQKRALMLADNKITFNAGWELNILAVELADLSSVEADLDIDLTGFEMGEIDVILEGAADKRREVQEIAPLPSRELPALTRRGDIWLLGPHRLMCGDALSAEDLKRLMQDDIADVGFTDPPYNVPIAGHVSRDGAVWFACMDWRHKGEMLAAGRHAFDDMLNLCIWAKTNGGMGSLYRSQHELVFVFRKRNADVSCVGWSLIRSMLMSRSGAGQLRQAQIRYAHRTGRASATWR